MIEERLLSALQQAGASVQTIDHEVITSAEAAAELRGTPLEIGGKALLMKHPKGFQLVAISSATRLDNRLLRRAWGVHKLRFATQAELLELTGLVPGTVPPFGEPILPFCLSIDKELASQPRIAFTAGRRDRSFVMDTETYLAFAKPTVLACTTVL